MTPAPARSVISSHAARRVGIVLALSAGILDVSVALLDKPQDFGRLSALTPPILPVASLFVGAYLAAWVAIRPVRRRLQADDRSAAAALGAALFTAFAIARLAELQRAGLVPHLLFRLAVIGALAGCMGIGTYASCRAIAPAGAARRLPAVLFAAPVLLFEVLLVEWVGVYVLDARMILESTAALIGLLLACSITIAGFLRMRNTRTLERALASFVLVLIAIPLAGAVRLGGIAASATLDEAANSPPRILLITIDTLRTDAVSSYAGSGNQTPAIDRIAADGVLFEHAIAAAPWTLPSVSSFLTGLAPTVHLVTDLDSRLADRVTTLAERLAARGYETAAIVHNPLLSLDRNLAQGFGEYFELHEPAFGSSVGAQLLPALLPGIVHGASWPSPADQSQAVVEWLEANRDRNFFLWVHFFDPHAPYAPAPETVPGTPPPRLGYRFEGQTNTALDQAPGDVERKWIRRLYDAEARNVDANVARITDALRRLGLYDSSLLVLTSDHGEEFWDHGGQGHGQSLYGELLNVPLVVKLPGARNGRRIPVPVSLIGLTPTMLDLTGTRYASGDMSAPSFAPLLTGGTPPADAPPIVATYGSSSEVLAAPRSAIIFDQYKYITSPLEGRDELFAMSSDPAERASQTASAPEQVERARRLLDEQLAAAAALRKRLQIDPGSITLDGDIERRLHTLGYVQ